MCKRQDSNKSYVWNLGGAYAFGPARISLAYEQTRDKGWKEGEISIRSKQQTWLLGLQYEMGPGRLNASFTYGRVKDVAWANNDSGHKAVKKYALGYTYELSKRTSIYGIVAYSDYDDDQVAGFYRGEGLNNNGDPASYNRAVSYTHLDVYKRQGIVWPVRIVIGIIGRISRISP